MFCSDDCDEAFDEILSGVDIQLEKIEESNDHDKIIEIPNSVNYSSDNDVMEHNSSDISIITESIVENHIFKIPNCDIIKRQKKKFPGPAGLITDNHKSNLNNDRNIIPLSQNYNVSQYHHSVPVFDKGPWCIAIDELINNKFNPDDYSIAYIKSKESSHELENHRTEILAGVIKSVDHNSHDPLITVKDPTGEFQGILHRDAWNIYNTYLVPLHSAVLLKRVTVLTVGKLVKNSYLNITLDNISAIYCEEESLSILNGEKQIKKNKDESCYRLDTLDVVDWNSENIVIVRCFDKNMM